MTQRSIVRKALLASILVLLAWAAPIQAQETESPRIELKRTPTGLKAVASPQQADKLHVVVLVFGHKGGISAACQKDCKAFIASLESAFDEEDEQLVVHDLSIKNPKTGK